LRRNTAEVLVSGILFAPGAVLHYTGRGTVSTVLLAAAYVVSGYVIAISAAKSLYYGTILDENFLMVILPPVRS
jgi:hypothetical protein